VALSNPTNPICATALRRLRPAAETLGVKLDVVELGEEGEIEQGFDAVRRAHPEAVLVLADLFLLSQRKRIAEFMTASRLPSIYNFREHVEAGGLLGYGADDRDLLRRTGYVDRILNGEKPSDLPVQQAERFDLLINLKTAAAIGLKVPPTLLDRADEVIE
jgi:putative ABC transport system substrate-binding protein